MTTTRRPAPATSRGFTLIEVLVALAIVAVALVAGTQATSALIRHGERQSELLLGQLCAENQLIAMRLSTQYPAVGESSMPCRQAGRELQVRVSVHTTLNPHFRRIDAQALEQDRPLLRLSTILGKW